MAAIGLLQLQLLLSLCLSIMTIVIGLLPVTFLRALTRSSRQSKKISWALTLLSCFAGGVILATCFLDILPHVNYNWGKYQQKYGYSDVTFPVPEFMACLGFFLVYFIEELIIKLFASDPHSHSHHHGINQAKDIESAKEPLTNQDVKKLNSNGNLNEDETRETNCSQLNVHEMIVDECARQITDEDENTGFLRSLTFALAMSFHSVLEGFALGVQEDSMGAITLFVSLLVDNAIDAFTVGLQVSRSNSKKLYLLVTTIVAYALMSPAGACFGMYLSNSSIHPQYRDLAIIVLESIAAGTFLFMIFLEILAHERENSHSNLIQLLAIIVGFGFISLLQMNEHFGGGDAHSHHG